MAIDTPPDPVSMKKKLCGYHYGLQRPRYGVTVMIGGDLPWKVMGNNQAEIDKHMEQFELVENDDPCEHCEENKIWAPLIAKALGEK